MHCLLYVLLPKEEASSSTDARARVDDYLDENNFCGDGGRWGGGIGDWFVIGGRWSGCLTFCRLDQRTYRQFWKEVEKRKLHLMTKEVSEESQTQQIQELFQKYFPKLDPKKAPCRSSRNSYQDLGYEDDAQIVDEELWVKIIRPGLKSEIYQGGAVIHTECIEDLKPALIKKEIVKKCWCVVVDFHY